MATKEAARIVRGMERGRLGVASTAAPVYTYNDLDIAFTTTFPLVTLYLDSDNPLYVFDPQPVDPDGQGAFSSLGEFACTGFPNNATFSGDPFDGDFVGYGIGVEAMVRPHPGSNGSALAAPTGFTPIWSFREGEWTIWRPDPPQGYAALGMVSTFDGDGDPPPTSSVVCVRSDLVTRGVTGQWTWADHGSGASEDCTLWSVTPNTPLTGEINFTPGTFVGAGYYGSPGADVQPFCLRLAVAESEPSDTPTPPALTGPGQAPPHGADSVQATTALPWFAVGDSQFASLQDQMLASPTYTLVREDQYWLVDVAWNQTSVAQTVTLTGTAGYNEQQTNEFSETTGIQFSAQFGGEADPVSFAVQLSQSFTVSDSISKGFTFDISVSYPVTADPETTVAAYWIQSTFQLLRQDGSAVGDPVTAGLDKTVYFGQYPPVSRGRGDP